MRYVDLGSDKNLVEVVKELSPVSVWSCNEESENFKSKLYEAPVNKNKGKYQGTISKEFGLLHSIVDRCLYIRGIDFIGTELDSVTVSDCQERINKSDFIVFKTDREYYYIYILEKGVMLLYKSDEIFDIARGIEEENKLVYSLVNESKIKADDGDKKKKSMGNAHVTYARTCVSMLNSQSLYRVKLHTLSAVFGYEYRKTSYDLHEVINILSDEVLSTRVFILNKYADKDNYTCAIANSVDNVEIVPLALSNADKSSVFSSKLGEVRVNDCKASKKQILSKLKVSGLRIERDGIYLANRRVLLPDMYPQIVSESEINDGDSNGNHSRGIRGDKDGGSRHPLSITQTLAYKKAMQEKEKEAKLLKDNGGNNQYSILDELIKRADEQERLEEEKKAKIAEEKRRKAIADREKVRRAEELEKEMLYNRTLAYDTGVNDSSNTSSNTNSNTNSNTVKEDAGLNLLFGAFARNMSHKADNK